MSRGKIKQLKKLITASDCILELYREQAKELKAKVEHLESLEKEVIFHMKEAHRLELENKKLKDKLREWKTEADRDKRHLAFIHLVQETDELLKEGENNAG